MRFPSSEAVPYLKMDGRDGVFEYGQGQDSTKVDMNGKVIALDMENFLQGWLYIPKTKGTGGADWIPLTAVDAWEDTPRPNDDYKPAVQVHACSKAFGDPDTMYLWRGNSMAHNNLVGAIYDKVKGDLGGGKMPIVKMGEATEVSLGMGKSVKVEFKIGPKDQWPDAPVSSTAGAAEKAGEDPAAADEWA